MRDRPPQDSCLEVASSWGPIRVRVRGGKILSCRLPHLAHEPRRAFRLGRSRLTAVTAGDQAPLRQADAYIRALFRGRAAAAPEVLWPASSTPFRARVWQGLQAIPRGATQSYSGLARSLNWPRKARAVGLACGANPLPLFIPCHRVVALNGGLGGFSCGLPWKRLLLERERDGQSPPA